MNTEQLSHNAALAYYDGPELIDRLLSALRDAGLDPDRLDIDDLAPLDEFHALGRPATVALARLAGIRAGERVLDVGAGIGGPARFLATRYGARVTAVDATRRFCQLAQVLVRATGLVDRIDVVCANALALPFPNGAFDLAWTQAVGQNIDDKARFVEEMARVLAPGGRVAMFEVVAGSGGELEFPVPWANGPEESWLVGAAELRSVIEASGLLISTWREGPDVAAAIGEAASAEPARAPGHELGLGQLMPDYEARMAAMARNVAAGRVGLVQVVAERP